MAEPRRSIYWDANLFLTYIEGTPGRLPALDVLLASAATGQGLTIATSAVTLAEVAFVEAEKRSRVLDLDIEAAIEELWNSPGITIVEFDPVIGRAARDLVRGSIITRPGLKPLDAIHLATALSTQVTEFHTYDATLHKHSGRLGFPISTPPLPEGQPEDNAPES